MSIHPRMANAGLLASLLVVGVIIGVVLFMRSNGEAAARPDWACTGVASMFVRDRANIAAEPRPAGLTEDAFTRMKAARLADVDKGLEWAHAGCNPSQDGGELIPAIYKDAMDKINSGQITTSGR